MVFVFVDKAFLCPTLQDLAWSNFIDENMLWSFKVNFGLTICAYVVCAMEVSVVPVPSAPPLSSLLLSKNSIEVSTRLLNW